MPGSLRLAARLTGVPSGHLPKAAYTANASSENVALYLTVNRILHPQVVVRLFRRITPSTPVIDYGHEEVGSCFRVCLEMGPPFGKNDLLEEH
mmetsp:Transcript_15911/g.38115  ORF Transcript_15911/g.38115 Transcript_15911/m.38115 type:complete len:93 (+) Transcript_15911:79-357(+)